MVRATRHVDGSVRRRRRRGRGRRRRRRRRRRLVGATVTENSSSDAIEGAGVISARVDYGGGVPDLVQVTSGWSNDRSTGRFALFIDRDRRSNRREDEIYM